MSPQKMSGYFLWENLVGRKLFKEETRQNYDRKLASHVLVMETIHRKVPHYVRAAYEAEAARMTASKRRTNYGQAANNLRHKLECSSDLAAHLPPATGTTSPAFCTLRAHVPEETPFNQSYQEDLPTPSVSELSASKMEIEARIEEIELEILLEENRRMMITLTPRLKAPVAYEMPKGSSSGMSLPFGRLASREFVNSFRMKRANRFAEEIFRLPKDITSFVHPYYLDFVVLSLFPYTLSQQKGRCFLASPCEIAAIRFSFSDGIVDQKVWHVRFDEEKMLGGGCTNVWEARDYMNKFKQKFGSPLHDTEFNSHLQDANQVWKELLEFAGIGGENAVTRIVYDIEQHNFIIPSLFYLSAFNKDDPLISFFDLLLPIQDVAISYNTIFGPIDMHPKVIDRYFQTRLRLLNDSNSICPLHGLNGIAHLKKLHCPFQHVARMMYLLLKFGYEAEFRDYDTMNAAANKLTCVAVSCKVNYDLSSPFPSPSPLDLSFPQPQPEPIMDDTGRPKDFEDYLKLTVRAKNPEEIRLRMEGKTDRRTSRSSRFQMEVAGPSCEEKRGRSEQKDQTKQAEKEEQPEGPTLETFVKIIQKKLQAEYYLGNQQKTRRPGRFATNIEAARARTQTSTGASVRGTKQERANIAPHNLPKATTTLSEPKKKSIQMTPSWLSRSMAAGTNLREDTYENDDPFDNGQYCREIPQVEPASNQIRPKLREHLSSFMSMQNWKMAPSNSGIGTEHKEEANEAQEMRLRKIKAEREQILLSFHI